jgi:hypothetical protein
VAAPVPPPYPGRAIREGEPDAALLQAVQRRLAARGCGPLEASGRFDASTRGALRLFQARFADCQGRPLTVDGLLGPQTWGALFGCGAFARREEAPSELLREVLQRAASQVGLKEDPPGSNRGPEVDLYLRAVGLAPERGSYPWCAAFVYYCFDWAAADLKRANPAVKTASVLAHWERARKQGIPCIATAQAAENPALVRPGAVFVLATGRGQGHMGFVEAIEGARLVTIEGNSNRGGSREGIGVYRREGRTLASINRGFIDYGDL